MNPIRLYIVDDHHVVRMGLHSMLKREKDIEVLGTAGGGAEALQELAAIEIDILLTDLRMQGMSGDELIVALKKLKPSVRAVVLTNYHSDEDIFNAVKAGAMGYILKTSTMEQVLEAIRSVHQGQRWIPAHISEQLAQRSIRNPLSPRELEVLQLLARGMRNREIGKKLYISEHTVRNHVISVMDKLGTTNRTEGVAIALQQGLVRMNE